MDEAYRDAMREHVALLAEHLAEIERTIRPGAAMPALIYRASERTLQLLIEACVGIAKQVIKARGLQVPSDARQAFAKLRGLGLDPTQADWNRIVGMRNALVHDYLNIQPDLIAEVITKQQYRVLLDFAHQQLR